MDIYIDKFKIMQSVIHLMNTLVSKRQIKWLINVNKKLIIYLTSMMSITV